MNKKDLLINLLLAVPSLVLVIIGIKLLFKAFNVRKNEKSRSLKINGIAILIIDCAYLIIVIGIITRRIVTIKNTAIHIIVMIIFFVFLLLCGIITLLKAKQLKKIEAAERDRLKKEKKERKKSKTRKRREKYHELHKEKEN